MLHLFWVIAIILLIVWLLGFLITPFMGGLIHILLVIAIIFLIIWLVQRVRNKH
ncbi:MAG: lmo0937 family membrane protein [Dehalococcoidales bacterium]